MTITVHSKDKRKSGASAKDNDRIVVKGTVQEIKHMTETLARALQTIQEGNRMSVEFCNKMLSKGHELPDHRTQEIPGIKP